MDMSHQQARINELNIEVATLKQNYDGSNWGDKIY